MGDDKGVADVEGAVDTFLREWDACSQAASFVGLTLGGYRGREPELQRVAVRAVQIKGARLLQFTYQYRTRDVVRNLSVEDAVRFVGDSLGRDFRSARLQTMEADIRVEVDDSGRVHLARLASSRQKAPSVSHDRVKRRLLATDRPFLVELGVCDKAGKVYPSMSRKWKQINKFLEIFSVAVRDAGLSGCDGVRVVDFGAGKGYLTFAVHDYLRAAVGGMPAVTGIERRADLVDFCEGVARRLGLEGLGFRRGEGVADIAAELDVLMALHACDTATDEAISAGIRAGAKIILCAPCCHKEIRPQLVAPEVLGPVLRHGVHAAQEAEMVTDALRALWLEWAGYRAQIIEFISLEHTDKNKMILGVRAARPSGQEAILGQIRGLTEFYGIRQHRLEMLLRTGVDAGDAGK